MRTDAFDFDLPEELIALRPVAQRDASRLLGVTPQAGPQPILRDLDFAQLPSELQPGDALVYNDTKVLAALLTGNRRRGESEAAVSVNLLTRLADDRWSALAKPARRLKVGDTLQFGREGGGGLAGQISDVGDAGLIEITFEVLGADLDGAIDKVGLMPLPHYIASKRAPDAKDRSTYQTAFADRVGAVAAPTAGLHFTNELLDEIRKHGVSCHQVTLHVGGGTFLPVKTDNVADHVMHKEWGEISKKTADDLNGCRRAGGRIIAVGTTSLRLLETAAREDGTISAFSGDTDIFITPGFQFRAVDRLLTNFHLPKSTLFMLVSAFSGLETMKAAYAHAIQARYRFYSYGDATLLDRAK